jgi:predicted DNA-binding transcriptional regulator YafY
MKHADKTTDDESRKLQRNPVPKPGRPDHERRLRQATHLARVLKVLELIQGRGRYGIKELAAELECSERTVFRDLTVLQLAGVPYYHDREAGAYRVRSGYRFPAINLTDEEAIGQAIATSLSSAPGLDITEGAGPTSRKLKTTSGEKVSRLLEEVDRLTCVLDLKLADHSRHHELIKTVQLALINESRLIGNYASPYERKPKRLDLHPYRICLASRAWYLIARPEGADRPLTYRITRFKSLRPSDAPANVPADFDIKRYFGNAWGVFSGVESHEVKLHFARESAAIVTETLWHHTQSVRWNKDGSATLTFRVDGLQEIARWILGWAGWVTVLEPIELREMIIDELSKALNMNRH